LEIRSNGYEIRKVGVKIAVKNPVNIVGNQGQFLEIRNQVKSGRNSWKSGKMVRNQESGNQGNMNQKKSGRYEWKSGKIVLKSGRW